jgi:hypothetical protein
LPWRQLSNTQNLCTAAPRHRCEELAEEVIAGHDPQLDCAVQEALRMLKENPVERRSAEPPPPT